MHTQTYMSTPITDTKTPIPPKKNTHTYELTCTQLSTPHIFKHPPTLPTHTYSTGGTGVRFES